MKTDYWRRFIYQVHERLIGRPTFAYLSELEKTQWLSRDEIEQLQLEKLTHLLHLAMENCPWHAERIRAAGLDVTGRHPITMDDLRRLPTMNKNDARQNVDKIAWMGVPGGAFKYNTGGSTGQPLIFYYGRMRQASDAAGRMRARQWWGVSAGAPEVYLWGAPAELNKTDRIKSLRDRLINQMVLNAFEMSTRNMAEYLQAIQSFRPVCLYGYASSIALLAAYAREHCKRLNLPSLKVVCTTGEVLYPHQRELVQEVFGVPVANEFGSRDIGFTAHESPNGQMLLMSESLILEVLDGEGHPVRPGGYGEAVVTALCSQSQPFIRYRTGDIIQHLEEACKDGRGLHVLGAVLGRSTDFVIRSDGAIMHALSVIYILRSVEGIAEFKFIQHTVNSVEVLVVPDSKWNPETATKIVQGILKRLGDETRVDVKIVDFIPPENSGKHRYVVSHVPLPPEFDL
ncbi:MAG: phenylacetate--CoA ligase family protein [Acidobacteria bacterium]|nr:phenylacetate--CoA ligase family protein [Acidobacteriota bacterium]MBI3657948.1 phenylacetate--CoA ligase family protein [Acidobacteriota bacterium]